MNKIAIAVTALSVGALGCGSSDNTNTGGTGGAGTRGVSIEFTAKVGDEDFVCGQQYDNLGADDTSLALSDFRFYVSGLELQNGDGDWVAVTLDQTNFQVDDVALLDFEDGCNNDSGNPETNTRVTGVVPDGTYDGLRFGMGVPFALNHENPATAPSPLNITTLQWDWQGGYKFLRIDSGTFSMADWRMHLGSTGCNGDPVAGGTTECSTPNVVIVDNLGPFDPDMGTVIADFAALVAGAPLDVNQMMTPVGCMSGPTDTDCGPFFGNLGLTFGGTPAPGAQSFFTAQ